MSPNDAVWNITLIICCFWKYLLEYYKTGVSIETFFSLSEVYKIMLNKFIWFIGIFLTIQQNSKLFNILIIALSHNAKNYAFESNKLLVKNHNQGHSALATERHGSYLLWHHSVIWKTSIYHEKVQVINDIQNKITHLIDLFCYDRLKIDFRDNILRVLTCRLNRYST